MSDVDVERLETERDSLRRDLAGTTEMLAFVLQEVGEPVYVSKATLDKGLDPNTHQIAIDDTGDGFSFALVEVS